MHRHILFWNCFPSVDAGHIRISLNANVRRCATENPQLPPEIYRQTVRYSEEPDPKCHLRPSIQSSAAPRPVSLRHLSVGHRDVAHAAEYPPGMRRPTCGLYCAVKRRDSLCFSQEPDV